VVAPDPAPTLGHAVVQVCEGVALQAAREVDVRLVQGQRPLPTSGASHCSRRRGDGQQSA
jgi:hypothetical protein